MNASPSLVRVCVKTTINRSLWSRLGNTLILLDRLQIGGDVVVSPEKTVRGDDHRDAQTNPSDIKCFGMRVAYRATLRGQGRRR